MVQIQKRRGTEGDVIMLSKKIIKKKVKTKSNKNYQSLVHNLQIKHKVYEKGIN